MPSGQEDEMLQSLTPTQRYIAEIAAYVDKHRCLTCLGTGGDEHERDFGGFGPVFHFTRCQTCNGSGLVNTEAQEG